MAKFVFGPNVHFDESFAILEFKCGVDAMYQAAQSDESFAILEFKSSVKSLFIVK